jgi:hypothetical protein
MVAWSYLGIHRHDERASGSPCPVMHGFTEEPRGLFPFCAGMTGASIQSHAVEDEQRALSMYVLFVEYGFNSKPVKKIGDVIQLN